MPNWVMNKIKVGSIKAIKECVVKSESGVEEYDFNKILPMPDYIYKGNLGMKEREKYGENNWYDWSIKNWGTKWNADNYHRIGNLEFSIQTAWATPEPVIAEMSRKYNCTVEVRYADEDCGYNCGEYIYRKGELIDEWNPEFGTDEARKFANETWGYEEDGKVGNWNNYIEYLKDWADQHREEENEGMSPASYEEFLTNEGEE